MTAAKKNAKGMCTITELNVSEMSRARATVNTANP
jgi:hypothetical protein